MEVKGSSEKGAKGRKERYAFIDELVRNKELMLLVCETRR
jgi:hypothetical protein